MTGLRYTPLGAELWDKSLTMSPRSRCWRLRPPMKRPGPVILATPTASPIPSPGVFLAESARHVTVNGGVKVDGVKCHIGVFLAGVLAVIVSEGNAVAFYRLSTGEFLIEHPSPAPGVTYVGNGKPRAAEEHTSRSVTEFQSHHTPRRQSPAALKSDLRCEAPCESRITLRSSA